MTARLTATKTTEPDYSQLDQAMVDYQKSYQTGNKTGHNQAFRRVWELCRRYVDTKIRAHVDTADDRVHLTQTAMIAVNEAALNYNKEQGPGLPWIGKHIQWAIARHYRESRSDGLNQGQHKLWWRIRNDQRQEGRQFTAEEIASRYGTSVDRARLLRDWRQPKQVDLQTPDLAGTRHLRSSTPVSGSVTELTLENILKEASMTPLELFVFTARLQDTTGTEKSFTDIGSMISKDRETTRQIHQRAQKRAQAACLRAGYIP